MKRLVWIRRVSINHHGNKGGHASARHIFKKTKLDIPVKPVLAQLDINKKSAKVVYVKCQKKTSNCQKDVKCQK